MAHLIDKSALVAETDRRLEELYSLLPDASKVENGTITVSEACNTGKYTALESFRKYIDTLDVKKVDLEQETKKWWKEHLHLDPKNQLWMDAHQSIVFAEHFYELGMQVSNKAQKGEEYDRQRKN